MININKTDVLFFKKDIEIFDMSSNLIRKTLRVEGLETKILKQDQKIKDSKLRLIALSVPKNLHSSGAVVISEESFDEYVEVKYAMQRFYDRYGD